METTPVAIYIHWPWCKAKCPYCDFNSHESAIQEKAYVEGLLKELESWRVGRRLAGREIPTFTPTSRHIESIFFGGGTPSLMSPQSLSQVISKCTELGLMDAATEVTVECNPTSFDNDRPAKVFFEDLKRAGVNRVSIGIQGLRPESLEFLGRTHRVEDALATLDAAQIVFNNVNADVIYGLPKQRLEDWQELLENLAQRGLAHISAYQLTIEQNTRFYKDVRMGLWAPIPADLEADFFDATRQILRGCGYENYEISNFARPGMACRHNVHVWKYGEYLGIGAGAHGRVVASDGTYIATQVVRQPEGYLRRMKDLSDGISVATPLNAPEAAQEAVFSGLRLATGVNMEMLIKCFGETSCEDAFSVPEITFLTERGLLVRGPSSHDAAPTNDELLTVCSEACEPLQKGYFSLPEPHTSFLRLTDKGWMRLNGVLERILRPLEHSDVITSHTSMPQKIAYKTPVTVVIE